ncbi:MAG TPA: helix-turn-helix transcriptional regulator [Pseudonocardiaceae bacterium]|jgi:transcriptional regulator with XRE-family HTH domain|nr:helix-turn-helix transcriptional regulator [Pseudonocardiaceae bacterium]
MGADMPVAWGLGENLGRIRKARNLSQEELAESAGVAVDTVARIERGERQTTRTSTLNKLARALGVEPSALLGVLPPPHEPAAIDVVDLRRALTTSTELPGMADFAESAETVGLNELRHTLSYAWRAYIAGRHTELLHTLPMLLADSRRLIHLDRSDATAGAWAVLSGAYRLGAGTAGRFGLDDLAFTAAERAVLAARQSDDSDIGVAASTRYLVWVLVRQGRTGEAERVAVHMAERVEPRMGDTDRRALGVFGNLLFNAASAAIRAERGERADELLRVAQAAAVRSGRDEASETAIFGPHVAAIQGVDHAVRLGDPERALRLADSVPDPNGPVPAFWAAGHRIHLAAAAAELRHERQALTLLGEAKNIAPDWVRYQPLGVAVMREIVDRAPRRRNEEFAELAEHYGVVA